ncbi:MAG: serine hydrolase [Flavobacteriales bacterium]
MLKHFLLFALLIPFFFSCTSTPPVDQTAETVRQVENGLCEHVYIVGDSTWSIEERMKHYGIPGMSFAVIKDHKIVLLKSYGVMDRDTKQPVTDSTLFQAGSISKPVAAYGAMKLAQLGQVHLDSNVNNYLRSWTLPDNAFTAQRKVAVRHLLNHTGGITVHGFLGYSPDLPVPSLVQVLNGEPPANSPPIRVDKLPGQDFRYSGGGYCILQQIMIDAKGAEFPAIMQELVLGPTGMSRSTYQQPLGADRIGMAATGYLPDGSMTKGKRHTYPEMAAAGLWTTAEDLAKFAIDLQLAYKGEAGHVLNQQMATAMLTPAGEDNGLGIFVHEDGDKTYFEHGGWDEGFSTQLESHRDNGDGVVVLLNANQPMFLYELIRSVARAYHWKDYVPEYTKQPINDATIAAVTGRYRKAGNSLVTISGSAGRLFMATDGAEQEELFRISDSTYVRRSDRHPIRFQLVGANSVTAMIVVDEKKGTTRSTAPRMTDDERIPFELVQEGKVPEAVAACKALLAADPNDGSVSEQAINDLGYQLLNEGKTVQARDFFHVNVQLYPKSANTYDSYAEACLKNGELELALKNYTTAYAMNPENANAKKLVEEIKTKLRVKS